MRWNRHLLALVALAVVLLSSVAWSPPVSSPLDGTRNERTNLAQSGIPLGWKNFFIPLSGGLDTLCNAGAVFNVLWGYNPGALCSLAVTSDPAMVAAGFDVSFGSDSLTSGYTASAYVGQARRDSTYIPVPPGAFSIPGRGSQFKVKGGSGGTLVVRADYN